MLTWSELPARMEGELVVVEPMTADHEEGLFRAGSDPEVWEYLPAFPCPCGDRDLFARWVAARLADMEEGTETAFTILDRSTGEPIGSTRYLCLRPEHRSLEVGWTWIGRSWWQTGANVETKLLVLGRAFDVLGLERVEFKTDARNARSRAALEALPARFEGIFRRHIALADGHWRDSAWYSVIAPEWPEVRENLRRRLAVGAVS
jgi:RimJ/RimL family protein N-acetyltransferase